MISLHGLRRIPDDSRQEGNWKQRCRDDFDTSADALRALTKEGNWPTDRWREALEIWWTEEELVKRSWHYMAPVVANAPDEIIQKLGNDFSWWLRAIANTFEDHEELFFSLARRILNRDYLGGSRC